MYKIAALPIFDGTIWVDTCGNIFSIKSGNLKLLKCSLNPKGYETIKIRHRGKHHSIKPHREVAKMFIGNIHNKPQVNHIDGNKLNNCIENLEWVTNGENQKHAHKIGLVQNTEPAWKASVASRQKAVRGFNRTTSEFKYFNSISEAAKDLKINASDISQCCRNNIKSAGNYTWEYIEKGEI